MARIDVDISLKAEYRIDRDAMPGSARVVILLDSRELARKAVKNFGKGDIAGEYDFQEVEVRIKGGSGFVVERLTPATETKIVGWQ